MSQIFFIKIQILGLICRFITENVSNDDTSAINPGDPSRHFGRAIKLSKSVVFTNQLRYQFMNYLNRRASSSPSKAR